MRQRGFSLIEVVIAVAIVVTVATFAFGMSSGARPMAMRSSVTQFDAALAYAKSLAATSGNGATVLVLPRSPEGFTISLYSGRPTAPDALHPSGMAPLTIDANLTEATLGPPPFAIYLNSAGRASIARTDSSATPPPLAAEPPCPAAGEWVLSFSDGRAAGTGVRRLACSKAVP